MTPSSDKRSVAGRSIRAKRGAQSGRERLRRLALDALEPRTLMSVLPPPQIMTRTDVSNTPGSEDDSPSISADPLDPMRAVAVWTRNYGDTKIPGQYLSLGEAAYTGDGGQHWTKLTSDTDPTTGYVYSLPSPLSDPQFGKPGPTTQYTNTTDLTVAFDRQHNFYVLESEHDAKFLSGALVLQKYSFANPSAAPNLTLANKIVHQWYDPNGDIGDQAHTPTLAVDTGVGSGQTNEPTGTPSGIVTGPDGNTYLAVQNLNQVQQLEGSSGLYQSIFASGGGFYTPSALTFNPQDGTLFISNRQTAEVLRVDGQTGATLGVFTQGLVTPKSPRDMVISPIDGNLYVSSKETGSVLRYNSATGAFLGSFVAPHSGGLALPEGLTFGPDGKLYVADAQTDTILRYDGTTGAFLDTFVKVTQNGGLDGPRGMVFGPDRDLYVVSQNTNQVLRYDRNTGNSLGVFAQAGADPENKLTSPTSLVFSPIDGNLLVTSFIAGNPNSTPPTPDQSAILRYSGSTGTFISSFLAPPLGGLDRPTGITFRLGADSGHDEILVGSEKTDAILRFDARTGVYLGPEVAPGSGSLTTPTGFAFAPDGSLYVSSGGSDELLHYSVDGDFLAAITPEPLSSPTDATLGPDGTLYAVSRNTDSVVRYDANTGKYLGAFVRSGLGGLNVPSALAFTPDGKALLVASSFNSTILKYDAATGAYLGVFIGSDPIANGGLVDPQGLIFRGGNLFVTSTKGFTITDSKGNPVEVKSGVVLEYNETTGAFIKTYTPEPLLAPESAVLGLDGNLYVSSSASNEVIKYDGKTGKFMSVFVPADPAQNGGLVDPRDLTFDAARGQMYVSSYGTNTVLRYNATTGAFLGLLTPEPMQNPQGTAFTKDNKSFLVASRDTNEVLKYDAATGKYLGAFISSNPALNGGLSEPVGIAFDSTGRLYVSSHGTDQVLRYNADGSFDRVWVGPSADMVQPEYLTFDSAGNLYVDTTGTDAVLRFSPSGAPLPGGIPGNLNPGAEFVAPGQGGLNGPEGMIFDAAGNLYVASNFTNQVLRYSTTGGTLGVFVADTTGAPGGIQSGVFNPIGLAFRNLDGTDYLLVSGGTGDKTFVQAYSPADGAFQGTLIGAGDGGLDGATSLIFSPLDGALLVANGGTNTVLRYTGAIDNDFAGDFTPPTLLTPDGLTLDPSGNMLYVASHDGDRVFKYAMNGVTADFLGYQDPEPLRAPQDVAISPTDPNHFYVVSSGNDEVLRYNNDGSFDEVFLPRGFHGIRNVKAIAFDSGGYLYVGSQGTSQIGPEVLKFDPIGRFFQQFVSQSGGPGQLGFIGGMAIDSSGYLFVTDSTANVVLRYDNKGAPAPSGTNPGATFVTAGQAGLSVPTGVSVSGNVLTVVSSGNGQVIQYIETTGATNLTLINDAKNLVNAGRFVVGTDGEYYVTSPGTKQIVRYKNTGGTTVVLDGTIPMPGTPTGLAALGTKLLVGDLEDNDVLTYTFGATPLAVTPYTTETLDGPEDLAFAPDGKSLVVSNSLHNDILKYDTTGTSATTFVQPGTGGLATPQGVTFGPDNNLYVSSVGNNEVIRYNGTTGAFIDIFVRSGAGDLRTPQGLLFAPNVGLLVVSRDTGIVLRYNPSTGSFTSEFTPEPLNDPRGMSFDATGDLYVASHGSDRVIQYDTTGNFLSKFTSDDLQAPQGAVLGPDGSLYVASKDNNEILRYYGPTAGALSGTFKDVFVPKGVGGLIAPTGVVFGIDGNLYVASSGSNEVLRYTAAGAFIGVFVKSTGGASDATNPQGLAVDSAGNLYVSTGGQVKRYRASSGAYMGTFLTGTLPGQAEGIAFADTNFDGKSEFYVADYSGNRVLQYDGSTGAFVKVYAQTGTSASNNMQAPTGIAFGTDQTLYVSSSKNSEVVRYQAATGSFLDVFVTTNRGGLSTPQGIVVSGSGSSGKLLVVSSDTDQVLSYNLTLGNFLAPFTPGPLQQPNRVTFGPDGGFYVSSGGTDTVLKYNAAGQLQSNYVGTGSGGLSAPEGLVFTADGSLLVASSGSTRGEITSNDGSLLIAPNDPGNILRFKPTTGLLNDAFQPDRPVGPTFETIGPDGFLYVSSTDSDSVLRYDPATGKLLGAFIAPGGGGLTKPQGLAFGADGNLYVVSQMRTGQFVSTASLILRFNGKTGQFIDTFVSTNPGLIQDGTGLTFGPDGNLYVASYLNDKVLQFSGTTGAYLSDYVAGHSGGLRGPSGIAFDAAGYLYVGSTKGTLAQPGQPPLDQPNSILRYKPISGNFDKVFVAPGSGGLDGPTALIFGPDGDLYVASDALGFTFISPDVSTDPVQDDRVLHFSGTTGAFKGAFVARGDGELLGPSGLAFGPDGSLYVTSRRNDRVLKYTSAGVFASKLGATPDLYGMAFTTASVGDQNGDGNLDLFVAARDLDSVQVYDGKTGEYLSTFIAPRSGGISAPTALAFSADGKTLYVSSSANSKVVAFDTATRAVKQTYSAGLVSPNGLLLGNGKLYVASQGNDSVLVFNAATGALLTTISGSGLKSPAGLAFDPGGNLLVTSASAPSMVLRFDATMGAYLGVYNQSAPVGFTDPSTNKSINDAYSNNVYIAWATNVETDAPGGNPDAIVLTQSSDGGKSFAPPTVMNDTRYASKFEMDATPRITISQGRLAGTLSPSDPGVPAGQVTVVWDDFGTNDFKGTTLPLTDAIVTDRALGGVSYSTAVKFDVSDNSAAIPASTDGSPVTTRFTLPVSITDPRFTSISHIDVRLSMIYPDLSLVQIALRAPDGTLVPLVQGGASGAGLGLQPYDAKVTSPFTVDTIFDDQASQGLATAISAAPYVGRFRPDTPNVLKDGKAVPGPGLSILNGMSRTTANGVWTLEVTDLSGSGKGFPDQRLLDWGLDFTSNLTDSKDVTVVAKDYLLGRLERYAVKGIDQTGPFVMNSKAAPQFPGDYTTGVDPSGINAAPALASDNTLGSFSPYQGRIYLAYVDGYINQEFSGFQPGDDTNIYLKYSDDGGQTWTTLPKMVNDDKAITDGFSEADISGGVDTGRPQFQPSIAVDPVTGTLALSFYDARNDPQHARAAMYVATSIDGGSSFAPETFVNKPLAPIDAITGQTTVLGPIPDNESKLFPGQPAVGNAAGPLLLGYGLSQGLAFIGGHLYPAWASNENGGGLGTDLLDIRVVSAVVAAGPRVVTSTMGPVGAQTVTGINGIPITFNNQAASGVPGVADGTPMADGLVIQFDRPVDPATLNPAIPLPEPIVKVTYRDITTSGFSPGVDVPVNPVITPLLDGSTPQGPTKFLVRFVPQAGTGTYSVEVGPAVRDRIRTVSASGLVRTGNLMDQNGNAITNEDPRLAPVTGTAPGDVYSNPTPAPTTSTTFSGAAFQPPYDRTTQPLVVPGPHIVSTSIPGVAKTPDNLVTDATVSQIAVTFDRDMDASTISGASVLRVVGPDGVIAGPYTMTPAPNQGTHLRTFLVGFPVQQISGTYTATIASTVRSLIPGRPLGQGEAMDTNQNAGLDVLRGDPTAGTVIATYKSNDAKAPVIGDAKVAGKVTDSFITVPDNFLVQNVTLSINLSYPFDPDLDAFLIAPDDTSVQLFSGVGQTGLQKDFSNTTFDDTANTPIQNGGPPFFGTFNPLKPLSDLRGHASTGAHPWILRIVDRAAGKTGTINNWTLNLTKPIPATGLGDPVADQATVSFRIYTMDPTNPLSTSTWTAVGPAGEGAKGPGLNAEISGRVSSIAVDPSDPSGNTVYVAPVTGGIWKTTNFLTTDPSGPTYVPLTDFGPTFGINVGSLAVFGRNNDPKQSVIFAVTGDADSLGVEMPGRASDGQPTRGSSPSMSSQGVGILRSTDGGATWTLLDSTTNFDSNGNLLPLNSAQRDHMFVGTAGFKIAVDPRPTPTGDVIVYAALSDVDANGQPVNGAGRAGGIWRSVDSGKTWTKMRAGQATDVLLDLASGTGAPDGNLQILYAAFRGEGVYRSPNRGQEFDLMTGTTGNPLIQEFDFNPTQPVPVAASSSNFYSGRATPNGAAKGRIVLARPSLTGKPLQDVLYQGWLYAAVVSSTSTVTADNQLVKGGHLEGLYLTKDFGQNWTRVQLPTEYGGTGGVVPTNNDQFGEYDPFGFQTPAGVPVPHPLDLDNFGTGNFNISLAVDPQNPNVVYLGGTSQFSPVGLMRIDTTGVADPHAFYMSQNDPEGGDALAIGNFGLDGERAIFTGYNPPESKLTEFHGPVAELIPGLPYSGAPTAPFDPYYTPYLNLIANPRNPFLTASTIPVTNTAAFLNSGAKARWTPFDQALKPDTFATNPNDPWSSPTRGVHTIVPLVDPLTGKTRLIFGDDNGVFTAVDDGKGGLVGSLGSTETLATPNGDVKVVSGSRNGNLQTAEITYGAAEPSVGAAQASLEKGLLYASTIGGGTPFSTTGVITPGVSGYGDITWDRPYVERASGAGIATVQTGAAYPGYGSFYRYVLPSEMDNRTGTSPSVVTDFLQRDLTSRTFNLLQNTAGQFDPVAGSPIFDVPDAQWPFRKGYNFAVNPLSGEQLLISSENGTVYSTENQGKFWNVIGNPGALDGTNAQALAYGAPDVVGPNLGNLNSFVYAGTVGGKIYVTFNGGGTNGNQWTDLSAGLDGSSVQAIVTNPTRTSHEAYAVTRTGVYHMVDSRAIGARWDKITGNLFSLQASLFNDPAQMQPRLQNLTSIQADWRYIIPDDFTNPGGSTHPMLYVGGEGGVFRSTDNGATWGFFPTSDPNGLDSTPSTPGTGGGLPNALVTDLDLVLGEIDPTNGRPVIAPSSPNVLMASTYGRGAFTIRLAPIVFPNTTANPTALHLSNTAPSPGGSDTGLSASDQVTNLLQPYIEGFSEQTAFGNTVTVNLYDMTDTTKPPVFIGTGSTDASGKFSIQVIAGIYKADHSTDGLKVIGIQATDQSGTKGNIARFSFTLDTIKPAAPGTPALLAADDSGRINSDAVTYVTSPRFTVSGAEPTAQVSLYRTDTANPVATRIGNGTLQDPGPLGDGTYTYYAIETDVAGNPSAPSGPLNVVIDTTKPVAPPAPALETSSDSGLNTSDGVTNVTRPYFVVTGTDPSDPKTTDRVVLFRKLSNAPVSSYVKVGEVIGSGRLQDTSLPAVPDGTYSYVTQQFDLAGNASPQSSPILVTYDTTSEGPPTTPDLEADSDTGLSQTDNLTSDTRPYFDVTATELNSRIELVRKLATDAVSAYQVVGYADVTTSLAVTIHDLGPIADGVYTYAAQQRDLAGNLGPRSATLTVTFDTSAGLSALSLTLNSKSDSGASNIDGVTNAAAPSFDVATAENNQSVQLYRKAQGADDSTYIAVGPPVTIPVAGIPGLVQDPSAPTNGTYVYTVQTADAAGNPGKRGVVTTTVTFDNIAPAAPAGPALQAGSDTGASSSDQNTSSTAPTFNVATTEASATIQLLRKLQSDPISAYVVVGTVAGTAAGTYPVTDSKLPSKPDGLYTYATRQVDLAGNPSALGGTQDVTIDTIAPAVPTLFLNSQDDTGTPNDNVTSVTAPRLDGKTEGNVALVLFDATTNATLATGQSKPNGSYELVPSPALADGTYLAKVRATDTAGNASTSAGLTLVIDTKTPGGPPKPQLDPASDSGPSNTPPYNGDGYTNVTSPFLIVQASDATSTAYLYRKRQGEADTAYVLIGQVVGSGKVQDTRLPAVSPDGVYLYATLQIDAAGNSGTYGPTLTVTIDTTRPAAPTVAPQLADASDSGTKLDGITNAKNSRTFTVDSKQFEANSTILLYRRLFAATDVDTSYTLVGQAPRSADPSVPTQITDATSLPDAKYAYALVQVDLAGNAGPRGLVAPISIDTQAPASPTLSLLPDDNSGSKADGITNKSQPRVTGVTEPGASIQVLDSGVVIATGTTDATTGSYTIAPTSALLDGPHSIQVRATDAAGNSSSSVVTLALTIDTKAPSQPQLTLEAADDNGLPGDGVTSIRRPHFDGVTEPRASVVLVDDAGNVRSTPVSADADGKFTVQPFPDLPDGVYAFRARATDQAGNVSPPTDPNVLPARVTIVTTALSTPTVALAPYDDTGVPGDGITLNNRPHFTGTSGPGVWIELLSPAGVTMGIAQSDSRGNFTVQPVLPLFDGAYSLKVRSRDAQGNTLLSSPISVTIDTAAPAPPALSILNLDDTGVLGDFVTTVRQPRLVGSSDPGNVIALYDDAGNLLSAVRVGADGQFTLQPVAPLKLGSNALAVRIGDAAGNVSAAAVPVIRVIRAASDYDGDGRSDVAVYDATSATFYIQYSGGGARIFNFGNPNGRGLPVAADFDGDGRTDIAVYDPTSATFYINYSSGGGTAVRFGTPNHNDMPVPGDYDGDGRTDIAIYDQIDQTFYILFSGSGRLVAAPFVTGSQQAIAVPGDYDGDGFTDIAVYDPNQALFAIVYSGGGGGVVKQFGRPGGGDLPIAGDFDGDGKTDLSVLDPGPSVEYQLFSSGQFGGSRIYQYGVPNGRGIPTFGDYDGDGKTDTTVFDPAGAVFYATYSAGGAKITQFGNPAHRLVPMPASVPPISSVGALSASSGTDFTPVEPSATVAVPGGAGSSLAPVTNGKAKRAQAASNAKANRLRHKIVLGSRPNGLKVASTRATAHDLALESLWDNRHGS